MRVTEYTNVKQEIVDFIERDKKWFLGLVVPPQLARPVYSILDSVHQRNCADLQLTLPVGFTSADAFVDQCREWVGAVVESMPDMPTAAEMDAQIRGRGQGPAARLQELVVWVREQMPQATNRRLTVALVPPVVEDSRAYHSMLARLSSPRGSGPSLLWIASTPPTAVFPRELVERPGAQAVAVEASGSSGMDLGSPGQRALSGLQAAGKALASGNFQGALCWCRVLTMHAVVREDTIFVGLVMQAQGDAFRGLCMWKEAHQCYRRALVALMKDRGSGVLLGGVLAALAVSGTMLGDPQAPHYVAHAQRLNANACLSAQG